MQWIAPTERDVANEALEKRLWDAADQLRANSGLKASEYSGPVLGLIFLRFAEVRFARRRAELEKAQGSSRRASRLEDPTAYNAEGVLYLDPKARFDYLLNLPEGAAVGSAVNDAMRAIERDNPQISGILPKVYEVFTSTLLKEVLKKVSEIPATLDYDAFGRIYEYFLGAFALTEGRGGGEFYTPSSIVRFLVEVLEPYHGRILDPACGSGGMFVQSARFVAEHKLGGTLTPRSTLPSPSGRGAGGEGAKLATSSASNELVDGETATYTGDPARELSIFGQEKEGGTVNLCRLNLTMHGLEGDIRQAITYYEDLHRSTGRFDFVLANPPFNVNAVDKERLAAEVGPGRRYPFGLPRADNGNYLWIELFYSALNDKGRAGFVMANSASDARASEQEIRRKLIEDGAVDAMVAVGPNMFYTVTLPVTLWFMDRAKAKLPPRPPSHGPSGPPSPSGRGAGGEGLAGNVPSNCTGARYSDTVLFIDARHIYRQLDRAHRDWTPAQIGFLANIVRLYRGESPDYTLGGDEAKARLEKVFAAQPSPAASRHPLPVGEGRGEGAQGVAYRDVPGLCKVATLKEIEAQDWSLNPGRYVGVAPGEEVSDEDFKEKLEALNEELYTTP
jgi:type I restriction enzyme M protein